MGSALALPGECGRSRRWSGLGPHGSFDNSLLCYNETSNDSDYDGHFRTRASHPDGRRIEWEIEAPDGKNVKLRIDGADYDLPKGSLFLVTTKTGHTQVWQLNKELPDAGHDMENCEAFAKRDPDVMKFIAEAANPK